MFVASRVDWARADSPDGRGWRSLWSALLDLRRSVPALGNGRRDLVAVLTVDHELLALVRGDDSGDAVLVAANLAADERVLALPDRVSGSRRPWPSRPPGHPRSVPWPAHGPADPCHLRDKLRG